MAQMVCKYGGTNHQLAGMILQEENSQILSHQKTFFLHGSFTSSSFISDSKMGLEKWLPFHDPFKVGPVTS